MADRAPDPILRTPGGTPFGFGLDIIVQGFGAAGVQDAVRRLLTATARLQDPGPLVRTIARRIVFSIKRGILEQRSPSGQAFAPLRHPRGPGHNPDSRALFDRGRLYAGVTYQERGFGQAAAGTFDVPYAGFMQKGTRPFEIRPRQAKVLRFWGGKGWVFSKKVSHPGITARPFVGVRPDDVPSIQQLAAAYAEAAFSGQRLAS